MIFVIVKTYASLRLKYFISGDG